MAFHGASWRSLKIAHGDRIMNDFSFEQLRFELSIVRRREVPSRTLYRWLSALDFTAKEFYPAVEKHALTEYVLYLQGDRNATRAKAHALNAYFIELKRISEITENEPSQSADDDRRTSSGNVGTITVQAETVSGTDRDH